jgi:predicted MFS family arabinose efflux permease
MGEKIFLFIAFMVSCFIELKPMPDNHFLDWSLYQMGVHSSRTLAWLMWLIGSLFYAYQYVLRVLPNIMMPEVMHKFQVDAHLFGQFSGFYYVGYALMHIPIGLLLDKLGPKWVLPMCILLTVIGLLPLVYSETWFYTVIGRGLIGIGSSGAILGVFKIIRLAFPEAHFTRMLGFSVTLGLVGAIYGGQPVNYLMQHLGWEKVIQLIAVVGMGLALLTFILVPNQPQSTQSHSMWQDIKSVLTNFRVLAICILAGMMVGPLEGFADVWGTEFLKAVYQLDLAMAAFLPSLLFLGMCFGSPLLSLLAEKTQAFFGLITCCAMIMATSFILILSQSLGAYWLSVLFFGIGMCCAYQILAIYKASTFVQESQVGLTTACANMIIMIFGFVFHSQIGRILVNSWDGQLSSLHTPQYSAQAYIDAISIIPWGLGGAALGFGLIWMNQARFAALETNANKF